MNSKIILVALLGSSAALFGCSREVTSSQNIKTAGIAALIDVTAESDSLSTVVAELRIAGSSSNAFVSLDGDDRIMATAADTTKEMVVEDLAGVYQAEFPTAAADTKFSVALERATDEESARGNSGSLPAPFEIGPTPDTKPSRANEDITLTWTAGDSSADMVAELRGNCIFDEKIDVVGDEGTLLIEKGTLKSTSSDKPEECEITVTMTRSRNGAADPGFDPESWFRLHQVRKASFVSAP
ncbi:MAG: hypothetical protein HUU06_00500 [Planctomycetaceae bacterium]|nr:hypothetical protein [Planctomycetaceae bacterium]